MRIAMQGQEVIFIDTSILCNIVPVPGFNQEQEEVRAEMGDLCILTERMRYEQRTQLRATIWAFDQALAAHNPSR